MKRPGRKIVAICGFTLVEVVIGLFLIVLVLGGSYGVVGRAQALQRAARDHYVAVAIAKNRIERAHAFQYESNLMLLSENALVVNDNGSPDVSGMFQRQTIVNTNYAPGLTEIKVVVRIRNRNTGGFSSSGPNREEMACLFTKYLAVGEP
jgi:type II secretory pathway component PulJ